MVHLLSNNKLGSFYGASKGSFYTSKYVAKKCSVHIVLDCCLSGVDNKNLVCMDSFIFFRWRRWPVKKLMKKLVALEITIADFSPENPLVTQSP